MKNMRKASKSEEVWPSLEEETNNKN